MPIERAEAQGRVLCPLEKSHFTPIKGQGCDIRFPSLYSSVPNRRVVPNKRAGGKILEN